MQISFCIVVSTNTSNTVFFQSQLCFILLVKLKKTLVAFANCQEISNQLLPRDVKFPKKLENLKIISFLHFCTITNLKVVVKKI